MKRSQSNSANSGTKLWIYRGWFDKYRYIYYRNTEEIFIFPNSN